MNATLTLKRNPNFDPSADANWDNPPYQDEVSNIAVFGPRGSTLTYPATLGWGYPMFDAIAVSNAASPPQLVSSDPPQVMPRNPVVAQVAQVAAVNAVGLSKAEWIAIAVLALALLA
jgi:hypothetical protein